MGLVDKVFDWLGNLLLERPARDKPLSSFREELAKAGQDAQQQLQEAADTPENREALRHVIAIERWGQRRLQVALGERLVMDESDAYYPAADAGWDQLRETFLKTRRETLSLTHELDEAGVGRDVKVPHNQWGDLSVYGWLQYLKGHASRDVKKIK